MTMYVIQEPGLHYTFLLQQVLENDIHAHEPSVKSIQEAGQRAMMSDSGKLSTRKRKLDDMTRLWNEVQEKSNHRHKELEEALREVQFNLF